jgi:hypothetical protein
MNKKFISDSGQFFINLLYLLFEFFDIFRNQIIFKLYQFFLFNKLFKLLILSFQIHR